MQLVIIEGVGKTDTIKKYLGKDFEVVATKGHIRDLPTNSLAKKKKNHFEPIYVNKPDKKAIINMLKEKSKKADKIYLATDPDREGEAISWHIAHILGLGADAKVRVTFNEITHDAVERGMASPRIIDQNLVNAQQARRVLDRLVGYKLSPIICKKIQPKLSAGRVQSATLKLIVDREREIRAFVPQEYWTLQGLFTKKNSSEEFKSLLSKYKGKKVEINNKEQMDTVIEYIKNHDLVVSNVKKSVGHTHPTPPYTTSTMQQDALNKLGMSIARTSAAAQQLYEGVELKGEGKVALITYIRTDSVRIAPEAIKMARSYILDKYGEKYLPATANVYKTKKSAQDAHEAIRPINLNRTPESVKEFLSADNYKLYKLIYNKFLACQMADSTYNSVVVDIESGDYSFRTTGKTPVFDGFTVVYNNDKKKKEESSDSDDSEGENVKVPELEKGELLDIKKLTPTQKFTKAPSRYTEATLVKEMEDKGIGRPATYAPTVALIANRNYTEKNGKELVPTELGFSVVELLEKYFKDIINVKFTANMESQLDDIAEKGEDWHIVIENFYKDFVKLLEVADKDSVKVKVEPKPTNEVCEKCGKPMVIRTGKYGEFMACSNYPACKNIKSIEKVVSKCPKCGGDVLEKHSKKGKIFWGCRNYPKCDFVSWEQPTSLRCPKCNSYLTVKTVYGKNRYTCLNKECDYVYYDEKKDEK